MYRLVNINDLRAAKAFVDYLSGIGITAQIQEEQGVVAIFVQSESDLGAANQELQRFIREPLHKRYRSASWDNEAQGKASGSINQYYERRGKGVVQLLAQGGLVTKTIAIVCIAVFALFNIGFAPIIKEHMYFFFTSLHMFDPTQFWRWISPVFIHYDPFHIIFNLLWWWVFGGLIEKVQGKGRLLILFVLLAAGPNTAQFFASGSNFGGLSGVVYGLLGYLWFYGRIVPDSPLRIRPLIIVLMMIWLVICFTGLVGPIANAAHLGGLFLGCVLGIFLAAKDKRLATTNAEDSSQ